MVKQLARVLKALSMVRRGRKFSSGQEWEPGSHGAPTTSRNPLREYFDSHKEGRGIWKWNHYFDVYHRHFQKFVGREVHVLEIGIYSGGSLGMWKEYFGPEARIYGVDLEAACKAYEGDRVSVFTGDQADRGFWKHFRDQVPKLDIVIDDGGHRHEQQIVTLEETLPHLRAGGVYLCEDVLEDSNYFAWYVDAFARCLNAANDLKTDLVDSESRATCNPTPLQSVIHSIHRYPFVTVIEKNAAPVAEFVAPKRGTEWQPFLD